MGLRQLVQLSVGIRPRMNAKTWKKKENASGEKDPQRKLLHQLRDQLQNQLHHQLRHQLLPRLQHQLLLQLQNQKKKRLQNQRKKKFQNQSTRMRERKSSGKMKSIWKMRERTSIRRMRTCIKKRIGNENGNVGKISMESQRQNAKSLRKRHLVLRTTS